MAWSFSLSEWCSTLGFVVIGLKLRVRELFARADSTAVVKLYVAGQTLDICTTLLVAWLSFRHAQAE
jgi:hypothetical protein